MSRTGRRGRGDDGSISLFFVVGTVALLLMMGLVVDGAGKIRAVQRADAVAAEAARAGGQSIAVGSSVRGNPAAVNAATARAAAQAHLAAAGVPGTVTVAAGTQLQVTTSTSYQPVFLTAAGVGRMTVTGQAQVRLADDATPAGGSR